MKTITLLFVFSLMILSCSTDEEKDPIVNTLAVDNLIYTVSYKNNPTQIIFTQEYTFENKKVISENYTNYLFPEHSSYNTFFYDERGRVIKEMRDDQLYRRIEWNNTSAIVFDIENNILSEFTFLNDKLSYYVLYNLNETHFRKLNYDSYGNVKSIEDENNILYEYLDYDTSVFNPLNLIYSIGILRIDYKPHFVNLFNVEKVHPFQGDDYSQPLRFYNYQWTLNADQLVKTIEDQKSAIYTSFFEYVMN